MTDARNNATAIANVKTTLVRVISASFILAPTLGLQAHAQDAEQLSIVSGAQLKLAIEGKNAPEVTDPEMQRIISAAKGSAYIAGVADLTSGKDWCGQGVAPHELTDRVYTHLGDVSQEKLSGQAAALVLEALTAAFPCQPNKN